MLDRPAVTISFLQKESLKRSLKGVIPDHDCEIVPLERSYSAEGSASHSTLGHSETSLTSMFDPSSDKSKDKDGLRR